MIRKASGDSIDRRVRAYLRRGVRSVAEARAFLERANAPQAEIAATLDALKAEGLLDERACARLWADHWARALWSSGAIREKLLEKGIEPAAIEAAAARLGLDATDAERAEALAAQKRHARVSGTGLARVLAARGFGAELIERITGSSDATIGSE